MRAGNVHHDEDVVGVHKQACFEQVDKGEIILWIER
jgi:hypothetical protein